MDGVNKRYNLEIEVLTPLFIGAGAEKDWVRGVDFVVENDILYKLDLKKMVVAGIDPNELTNYFASKNEAGLKSKISDKLLQVSNFTMRFPIETDNDIKVFVKNQFTESPLLVGSSMKGALRSVLFGYLGDSSRDVREVFGSASNGNDFMRFIKISDAEFLDTELVNTKIFNLQKKGEWAGGWKHGETKTDSKFVPTGFNTVYECLIPKQKGLAMLMMSEIQFKRVIEHMQLDKKTKILEQGISFLFSIINEHAKVFLTKERRFFEKYDADKTDLIIKGIDNLINQIPEDNSYCVIRMSAGSGFHSITGDWQFDDFANGSFDRKRNKGKILPKSRKIAIIDDLFYLPGFVKMRNIGDDELLDFKAKRQAELEQKLQERQSKINAARQMQLEKVRAEEERRARRLRYDELVAKAHNLYMTDELYFAKEVCSQANRLFPNLTQHQTIEDLIESKLRGIENERIQKEQQEREATERRERNSGPLANNISKATKIGTLIGNVKTWLKYNDTFSDSDLKALFSKLKEISSTLRVKELKNFEKSMKWNEIVAFVGEDTAKEWFVELTK